MSSSTPLTVKLVLKPNTDNQIDFKAKHGTDFCINAVIKFWKPELKCFNTSKASDHVNRRKLLIKLKERGVPVYHVKILAYWCARQMG